MKVSLGEEEARALLQEERTRFQQLRVSLAGEPDDEPAGGGAADEFSFVDQHVADLVADTSEVERDVSILEHIDAQLADIDHAMERLEDGSYGLCEACGRPIDEDRLRARPAARFCLEDQARTERAR